MLAEERMIVLANRYGSGGCLDEDSAIQAMYAEITGVDGDLDEQDLLWIYEGKGWCVSQTAKGLKRARVLDVVSSDVLRIMTCNTNKCVATFPNSYLVHLYNLNLPAEMKTALLNLKNAVVDIKEMGVNDDGYMEVIVYAEDVNINDLLKEYSVDESVNVDTEVLVLTKSWTSNPINLKAGDATWIEAEFRNMGNSRTSYKYYLGVSLTDRDGTEWVYSGNESYGVQYDAGEVRSIRARFTVPTYMDAPITVSPRLYKVLV